MMPGFLDRFGTKPSSKLQTPPNTNSRVSSRPISPASSPQQPKISLPRERTISNVGNGSSGSVPNLILTHEDDSPMSVTTPGSLHRADSAAGSRELPRKKSLSQLSTSSKSHHQRIATMPAGMASLELDVAPLVPQKPDPRQTPNSTANGSKPSATTTPPSSISGRGQLSESPTNGPRRSGSVSSTEEQVITSTFQPLHLVESPKSDEHGSARARERSTSAVSEKESGRTLAVNSEHEVKKRKSWRRPSATEATPQFAPFQLQTAPTLLSKKPQTRHQSTMGMGLASALAASGLGVVPPSHVLALSPPPGQSSNMALRKQTSGVSSGKSTASVSPVRSRRSTTGRPRDLSNASSSTAHPTEGSGSDDSAYDSGDALDFGDDDIPITGFAVATMKRNQEFHELFPTIPADDYLIDDYGCALQRDILIQGRVYISENHMCFHANIFGWVTTLVIPFHNVKAIEKKMTAFVIPNAIGVTENSNKYTFASFLARDTAYDVIYNIWKHSRPEGGSAEGDAAEEVPNGLLTGHTSGFGGSERGGPKRKVTQCACSRAGAHYSNVALEAVVSGTPEQIYNLMFQSGFIKDFMAQDQKLFDIQVSDWQPSVDNAHLLSRNMSYIKPLSGGFGPKQTKCELRDENHHVDFDDYVTTITTTRTPDVPSGGVFAVKTRTCIMWAGASSSRITVTYTIEWTGKSFIKGIIERGAGEGQLSYYKDLEVSMRKYIAENRKEFLPEGVDAAEADHEAEVEEAALSPTAAEHIDLPASAQSPSLRGLQWALDTFEGASKVAKDSFTGALDIIGDVISGLDVLSIGVSRTTILTVTVVVLLISNVYTILTMGDREAMGRRKALEKRGEEREKWFREAVREFLEVQRSMNEAAISTPSLPSLGVATSIPEGSLTTPVPTSLADIKTEVKSLVEAADTLERRIAALKNQLEELN